MCPWGFLELIKKHGRVSVDLMIQIHLQICEIKLPDN